MVEFSLAKQLGGMTKRAVTWLYDSCVPVLPQGRPQGSIHEGGGGWRKLGVDDSLIGPPLLTYQALSLVPANEGALNTLLQVCGSYQKSSVVDP
jgi:hypothetical protein